MSKAARRFLTVFTLLCMVAVTAFLCIFLLFKIKTIEVTGDVVYEPSAVIDVCGYEVGDNLVLLSTGKQEKDLEEQLPYVEQAEIIRHFPSTLEIHITAAQEMACVASGSQWFAVSGSGKILEEKTGPDDTAMQVTGLDFTDPQIGSQFQAQDQEHQDAFQTILSTLADLGAVGEFTSLDLTDLYNITMSYQGRVTFELGSTVGLDSKIQSGYRLVTEQMEPNDIGTLDLSLVADIGKAYFSANNSASSSSETSSNENSSGESGDNASSSDEGGDTSGENGSDDTSGDTGSSTDSSDGGGDGSSSERDSSQEGDRGGDIPDTIFTG